MKTTFTLTIILFLTIMLGMALSSSKQLTTEESSTPTRYWFKSPTGVPYIEECINNVLYIGTETRPNVSGSNIVFAYTGKLCNTTDSNIEEK